MEIQHISIVVPTKVGIIAQNKSSINKRKRRRQMKIAAKKEGVTLHKLDLRLYKVLNTLVKDGWEAKK